MKRSFKLLVPGRDQSALAPGPENLSGSSSPEVSSVSINVSATDNGFLPLPSARAFTWHYKRDGHS